MRLRVRAVLPLIFCAAFGGARADTVVTAVFDRANLPYSIEQGQASIERVHASIERGQASIEQGQASVERGQASIEQVHAPGLNVEIARLIAEAGEFSLEIRWVDPEYDGLLSQLLAEEEPADIAVGVPIEPKIVEDEVRVGGDVAYSIPFASARFVMVTRKDMPELPNFRAAGLKPIGVETATVASTRLWEEGYIRRAMPSQERVLTALAQGDIDYAVLWNSAGWMIEQNGAWRDSLKIQAAAPETYGFSWNFAVALRLEDTALLGRVNEAIERLAKDNAFAPVFKKYHVPYFEPEKP